MWPLFLGFKGIFGLKGLKPKNKGHTNFYECCDLTNKVYLEFTYCTVYIATDVKNSPSPCLED